MIRPAQIRFQAALLCVCLAAGCSSLTGPQSGGGLAFSSRAVQQPHDQAGFARGGIVLVPPKGFCIDSSGIRRTGSSGFAMMARCDALGVRGFFGNRSPAVITATIGPRPEGAPAPSAADLAQLAGPGNVLEQRSDLMLPLVRLQGADSALPGAAPVHWRGALVLDSYLLSVALYAPEGSDGLKDQGALLLNDLARRTLEASLQAPVETSAPATGAAPPADPGSEGPLRPRSRPGSEPAAAEADSWFKKLSDIFS